MRRLLLILGVAALAWGGTIPAARAAENCAFQPGVESLAEARKKTESVKPELEVRKNLLALIIDCAVAEANVLQGTVKELNPKDGEIREVRDHYGRRLEHAVDFYESERRKIGDLGIRGSKDMAKEMLSWRTSFYKPLADATANLVIWIRNQHLFGIADQRFVQIGQTVRTLKLMDDENIGELFENAERNLVLAKELNAQAKTALRHDAPPADVIAAIKSSLEALAKTYESFFELSEAVKKLLPI